MGGNGKAGSKYFLICWGSTFLLSMIFALIYESGFLGADSYIDSASNFFSKYLGVFRIIDVGMSGGALYKSMASIQIIASPLMFFLFMPMRNGSDIFGIDKLASYLFLLALCLVFLVYGPVNENPEGRGRGLLSLLGANFVTFGIFISGIFSLTLALVFSVVEVIRRTIVREH